MVVGHQSDLLSTCVINNHADHGGPEKESERNMGVE